MRIDPKNTSLILDPEEGSLTVKMDLVGETPSEHEVLAAFFKRRSVALIPAHVGDDLRAEFTIYDPGAVKRAQHNLENRQRKADGRPSIEEEREKEQARHDPREPIRVVPPDPTAQSSSESTTQDLQTESAPSADETKSPEETPAA